MSNAAALATLQKFLDNHQPSVAEARAAFLPLTTSEYTDVHIAALLIAIRTRGETYQDIAGAALAFLDAGIPFPLTGQGLVDAAGTGGDGAHSINISTAASLVAAAGGVKMVKHGNRSVSSKSGSADVLEALQLSPALDPASSLRQFEASNFTFLFAPTYNPAVAHVQNVRRELGVSTLFNTLGPLLSPARPEFQLMGIANPRLGEILIQTLQELGRTRALVVHGAGTDELAVHGPTEVWELAAGKISHYQVEPADLGVATHALDDLRGGDAQLNAELLRAVFARQGHPAHTDAIAVNAGALFYLAGQTPTLAAGTAHAQQLLQDGTVQEWLNTHAGADYAH